MADTLNMRETEVVKLLLQGYSDRRIAFMLTIRQATVLYHLRNVATKWGVTTRREIREAAPRHGIEPD
jgi:DNA-binding NarL/FixJ family response regulator